MRSIVIALLSASLIAAAPEAADGEPRAIGVDDLFAIRSVGDPRLSPDGRWVAYTVRRVDAEKDALDTDIYLVSVEGGEARRFTRSDRSETRPRFSPDGRSLAFLSSREGDHAQVWLADLRGGDPAPLTSYEASVSDLAWSPDGRRLAVVVSDVDPDAPDEKAEGKGETPKPIVIRRLQFKRDGAGYLREIRDHIHLFDVGTKASVQLTSGPYDDSEPAWSPDGRQLAFVSNRTAEPDSNDDTDIFLVEAAAGAEPRRVVDSPGTDRSPAFSPDGAQLVFVAGGDPARIWYATPHLGVVPAAGGPPRVLTRALDRHVSRPRFSADGRSILFLLEDGGNQHLARIPASGGPVERIVAGEREVRAFDAAGGESVVLESRPDRPGEVYRVAAGGRLEPVTRENEALFAGLKLGRVERYQATSPGGTRVDAFLTHPPSADPGEALPAVLRIHGGPVGQYSTAFNLEWQILAAHGYAVIAANPRGSSGYGEEFSHAIWADWGNKDYEDVMAAVDRAVEMGVADPDRLGVGGWSYGGILTNYVITKTDRFRAAISGASEVNYLSNYGTDHYQHEWETELGLPWENTDLWIRLSPFFDVEKIVTPTLILCGEKDANVPLLNSEQLYQALRRLGRETELVIYPGQNHGIRVPSYQKDRFERYVAWYDRFVKGETPAQTREAEAVSLLGEPLYPRPLDEAQRKTLEANLEEARSDFARDPDDAERIIWLGRRLAYLERYREAIDVYTRGIRIHPVEPRLYRHRGHRYISTRRFEEAVADLEKAAELVSGRPAETEPDGIPSARGVPTTTTQFNVYYHLGLAHYLLGELEEAAAAYRECLRWSQESDENRVATTDWLHSTLRRLGRRAEATELLEGIHAGMDVVDNRSYLDRLLFYQGQKPEQELLGPADALSLATQGYGVANWHLVEGNRERARTLLERVLRTGYWAAFGYIAAEADLARMRQEP